MRTGLIKSKFFIITGSILLIVFLSFLGRQIYQKYEIDREIRGFEAEVARLQSQNQDLTGLLEYFKTSAYKERQARLLLNLKKPGEFAVALPAREEDGGAELGPKTAETFGSNFQKWSEYFFKKF